MDIQTIWRFVAWLVGCSIPAGVVIYVFKQLVKTATARITTVVDAYAGERAKLLAQFHNLDKLVEQTARLTETTKLIESRVSYDLWDRQMRWGFKRDIYIRLMEALGERLDVEGHNKLLEQIRRRGPTDRALLGAERDKAMIRAQDVQARLVRAACVGPLVISADSHQVLIETNAAIKKVNYDLPDFETVSDYNLKVLQDGLNRLFVSARKDLGIEVAAGGVATVS